MYLLVVASGFNIFILNYTRIMGHHSLILSGFRAFRLHLALTGRKASNDLPLGSASGPVLFNLLTYHLETVVHRVSQVKM